MKHRRRYLWLGIAIALVALAVGAGAWLALAGSLYERIGPGHMTVVGSGGPLVVYEEPGAPGQALSWREMTSVPLKVAEIQPDYTRDDGIQGQMRFRVVDDGEGRRWVAPVQGSNAPIPSPDRSLYFFEDWGQLYLLDANTLKVTPLTPWQYQGKTRLELIEERGGPIFWVGWPLWTPDGRAVVYTTDRSGEFELRRLDVETRTETVVTSCRGNSWVLNCWTDDGRLLVQDYGSGDNPDTLFVLDTETGATAQLTQGYYTNVYDPYIVAYQKPGQASSCILYDINRRSTTVIPVAPQGYTYQMPFFVSPGRTRIAIWLTASNAEQVIGVMDVTTNPASLRMFAPPTRVMGELMWLDDGTVIVQSGAISDPDRATWALKVGDRK